MLLSLPRHLSTLKVALATRSPAPAKDLMAREREPELCGDVPSKPCSTLTKYRRRPRQGDPSESLAAAPSIRAL